MNVVAVGERPEELQLWLEFAALQVSGSAARMLLIRWLHWFHTPQPPSFQGTGYLDCMLRRWQVGSTFEDLHNQALPGLEGIFCSSIQQPAACCSKD